MDESDIPDRWSRAKELFERAVELPPDQRDDFVARECALDRELLAEVASLLRADAARAGVLDRTLDVASLGLDTEAASGPLAEGTQIGAWRLVRPLGHGGMGIVYLAERADATFTQRAALKIVRGGLASRALEERFLRERRILARLEHPGIARLLDGGLTPEGQPWFAMELVEGEPITTHAEGRALDVDTRLQLFLDVCTAVQYAHRQLVIHRDLKPANILIDAGGRARLLDFGVARLLGDTADEAALTRAGFHALTPACAAPEQIRGEPPTTATDVFQLGTVLYELLCGKPIREGGSTSPTELVRLLDQAIPPLASHRDLSRALARRLHGDLETIVACALAAEAGRRYASVEALAADIERHLESRPVKARPASTAYRLSRYVRRHRIGVAASAVVLLLLVAGTAGIAWQAVEARREAARAREMSAFLQDLFDAVDPDEARGRVVTARELLDNGADRIDELEADPDLRVDVLRTLGKLYYRLGAFDRSESLLRKAEKESLATFGPDDVRTARVRAALGYTMTDAGRFAEAEPIIATAVATGRESRDPEAILDGLEALAHLRYLQGRYQEACDVDHELLPLVVEFHGPRSAELAGLKNSLGACSMYLDHYDEAERFYAEAVSLQREIHGNDHTAVADTLGLIAILRGRQGRYKDAEPLQREALAIRERVLAPEHPDLAISYDSLARNLDHQGRREEARALHERALELQRRVLGLRHPDVAASLTNLSTLEYRMGNLGAALAHQLEAIAIYRETIGETRNLALAVGNAGVMLRELGRYEEARRMLEESLAMRRRHSGEPDTAIAAARMHLATLDRLTGRLASAESQFRQALAIFVSRLPDGHTRIAEARTGLGATLLLSKRASEALPLLERAHAALRSAESVDEVRLAECRLWFGAALARQSRRDEARDHLQQARTVLVNLRGPEHALSVQASAELAAIGP